VRIGDVAAHLIRLEGRPIPIQITGLRPGEKLHEHLFGAGEHGSRPIHPMISHVPVPPLDPSDVDALPRTYVFEAITAADHRDDDVAFQPDIALQAGDSALGVTGGTQR